MEILAARSPGLEASRALVRQGRLVGRAEVCRAAEEPRDVLREHVEHVARRVAAGDALGVRREHRKVPIPAVRQVAALHLLDLGRELRMGGPVRREERRPLASRRGAARPDAGGEVLADGVRHQELCLLRPAVALLGETNLRFAERLAVSRGRVVLVRRAVADVAVEDDQGRASLRLAEDAQRAMDALEVVGVAYAQDVPAIGEEPRGDILGESQARLALDRDVVVVVDPTQIVEAQVARQRGRLGADALHQTAVSAHDVDVVVEDREAGFVVAVGEPLLGDRHPHARRDALPQRPRGGFDSRYPVILGVPRRLAVDLTEAADVVERHRRPPEPLVIGIHGARPGEMQDGPEQHRGMAVREHESIAVGPDRILRIESHHAVPQRVHERR